ncbi:class I SAM-dependent methyltransferase [Jiulongibacter sp. NS-SX5]|uniref:class I SAM-dependent methyltransferase n=1 Tax=Jiulongibacter sp. NS-SX5 TaxID=3463854 RepID=UPI004059ED89
MKSKLKEDSSCESISKNSCCGSSEPKQIEIQALKDHWNKSYETKALEQLGWYEENPTPSLQLIEKTGLKSNARIFNAGAGATTLVDELLKKGFQNIIINDLSSTAIELLKNRLGEKASNLHWIEDDLTNARELQKIKEIDLWHDRAVLHFFHDRKEQKNYFDLIRNVVKPGGFVIIAAFNLEGATSCSGLPVFRYNAEMIKERIGEDFELIEAFDYTFTMPSKNTREYVYSLFKRMQ